MNQSIDLSKSKLLDFNDRNFFKQTMEIENQKINLSREEPLKNQLSDFLNSVKYSSAPLVGGADGLSILKVAKAALESLRLNKVVKL